MEGGRGGGGKGGERVGGWKRIGKESSTYYSCPAGYLSILCLDKDKDEFLPIVPRARDCHRISSQWKVGVHRIRPGGM